MNSNNVGFTYRKTEGVAVVRLGSPLYAAITSLEKREEYFARADSIDADDGINVMLTINEDESFDERAYEKLLTSIVGEKVELSHLDSSLAFKANAVRSRQLFFFHYLIKKRLDSSKLIVDGLQGVVATPFLGACLAADFRFATPDMRFSLCHVKYGLHPSASLVFFLPRFLGHSHAVEMLLKGGEISAPYALELGLINQIFPKEEFEQRCLEEAKKLCKTDASLIGTRKMLYSPLKSDLESCFELETELYLSLSHRR